MILTLAAVATGVAAVACHGALHRNSRVFGPVVGRLPGSGKDVALTFDDGPNPHTTPRILEVLEREQVPATFFLLGKHVERWPDIAAAVHDGGHAIGNHGYHHRKLHLRGPGYVRLDIALGADAIGQATGGAPRLFRAPHGFRSPWVHRAARDLGQRCVGWTLGVWDSDKPGANEIARRSVEGTSPGTILLLHDGDGYDPDGDRMQTAQALPTIIGQLRDRGYRFVTV